MERRYKDVRQTDVAERAGVSTSTVSHVLRGTRYVAPDTRRRVLDALSELGYEQADRPSTARWIGLSVTAASNPYIADLILGVESEARRNGYALLLCDSHDDPVVEADNVSSLIRHRVDGMVLGPTSGWVEHSLPQLEDSGVPYVLVDRLSERADCDQVGVDGESSSCELVAHLLRSGHRRVAMVSGIAGISTTTQRLAGYRRALAEAGLDVDEDLIVSGESTIDGGRRAAAQLLKRKPTAFFIGNNAMTIGALLAFAEAGVKVPQEVAMVAFDDLEWAEAMQPRLTVAAQPFHAVGARAVQMLQRRIAEPLRVRERVLLPASIEHRDSCGCNLSSRGSSPLRRVPAAVRAAHPRRATPSTARVHPAPTPPTPSSSTTQKGAPR